MATHIVLLDIASLDVVAIHQSTGVMSPTREKGWLGQVNRSPLRVNRGKRTIDVVRKRMFSMPTIYDGSSQGQREEFSTHINYACCNG